MPGIIEQCTLGPCRLILGDCREVLPDLPMVDAIVTDPPYGVNLRTKKGHYRHAPHFQRLATYNESTDTPEDFQTNIVPRIAQALQQASCAAVCAGERSLFALPPGIVGGFYLPSGCGMGPWGFVNFMHVVFYGADPYLTHQRGSRPNGKYGLWANDSNTISHPCAKPLAAMVWLVERVSFEGHSILDPFMGSGTTGVACVQLGRSFIGIEIDPQYYRVAVQRISEALRQLPLFPPQTPAVQQPLLTVPKQKRTRS
jgi:hypothetical protein